MKRALMGIIKLVLVVLIMLYAESYCFEFLAWLGINANSITPVWQEIIILLLYILILYAVFIIYRDDLENDFYRFRRNWFPNILMSIVFFAVITIVVWVVSYLCEVTATAFGTEFITLNYLNVFKQAVDLTTVIFIIKNVFILPFIYCTVYILGINEIFTDKKGAVFFSGLVGAIVAGLGINGDLLMIIFNVIPYFTLYFALAYIYRKNNSNIWYSLTSIILYTFLASVLIEKIT